MVSRANGTEPQSELSYPRASQWTGEGSGSSLGNRFFMRLIRAFGVLPAYVFLFPAILGYVLFDRKVRAAHAVLRQRLGMRVSFISLYRHVYSFGMSMVDRFAFLLIERPPYRYTCDGEGLIKECLSRGRGVILLSAHIGNWEVAGNLLGDHLGVPINVVLLDAEREALQRIYRPALDKRRFRVIAVSPGMPDASVEILARLRAGEIVCMLGDRVVEGRSVKTDFLGAPASFPLGPFAVAAVSGAPVVPVFVTKRGALGFTFKAYEPILVEYANREQRETAITESLRGFTVRLENVTRSNPDQWFNFFDFWAP